MWDSARTRSRAGSHELRLREPEESSCWRKCAGHEFSRTRRKIFQSRKWGAVGSSGTGERRTESGSVITRRQLDVRCYTLTEYKRGVGRGVRRAFRERLRISLHGSKYTAVVSKTTWIALVLINDSIFELKNYEVTFQNPTDVFRLGMLTINRSSINCQCNNVID